ncbi:BTB/POZ domain-containing protein 2-like isoform X2 [Pecten maximus]|uniref:BTB/POZ domain-containing protein 2-like isoform X2 n=1 Tax=Pecten maximus TaxID=6579 RepID=UPI0014583AB1|nr:BTB/POZ domain-containing protein 2-like isoform X2 [Pecten maximus]XP_033725614.1 BTB/POZ domain-containing protein 2-like isoform X2 [Pecten maximus]
MAAASPPSDWQVGKTLSESFDHLLTSGIASDVTFIIGEERNRISAHKLVLLSRSPVFYAMLEGPMADKGEITIPDISADTFKLFLRYLYTDKIDLTDRNVVPVFNVARKYCVDILVSLCEEFLSKNLTAESACVFLEQAYIFVADSLQEECLRYIVENATVVLRSVTFTDLSLDCVTSITESDDLKVTERSVYEAVIRWAEEECSRRNIEASAENKRDVLGDTLYTVRYLHIDEDFLLGRICSDKILKAEDVIDIVNHNRNHNPSIPEKLNTKRRLVIPQRFHRNGPVTTDIFWNRTPVDEAISFKSSVDVYLFGFGSLFSSPEQGNVNLKVFEEDECLVEATKQRALPRPDTQNMGDVVLDIPIKIHAGKTYTILERSHNQVNHYFEKGITKVTHQHITIEFSNSPRSKQSNIRMGHIPYLLLSG